MRWKRGIVFSALLWVLIFFEVSFLMFGLNLSGTNYYITHYILAAFLSVIIGIIYFGDKNTGKGFIAGLKAAFLFLVVGLILDFFITVLLFVKDAGVFFGNVYLWIGYLEGFIIITTIGSLKK